MTALPPWIESAMFDAQRDPPPVAPDQLAAALRGERPRIGPGELSGDAGQPREYRPITAHRAPSEPRMKVNRGTVGKPDGPSIKLAD
jgi:hypothetical protein